MATIPGTLNTQLTDEQVLEAFDNALTHTPSDSTPKEDGSGSAGEAETFARSDHEHPHDTTKQDTLAFEGTYSASTNKAATMSAVKDGKLTGYAQLSGNVAATDKVIEAIGKVEKKADDNKTNILLLMNGANHNGIYRGNNLGDTLTDAQHTALSGGDFTDLYLGDYWTKSVTIPAGTYTGGDGEEATIPSQTVTLKAVIADFDTFYAGRASGYAAIDTHHAAVIVTGFNGVAWNKTNSTTGGYANSLIHKWLVGSALPQIESWFGSARVLAHQKILTNAISGAAASGWAWSSQKISLLSECQMYGCKVWGGIKATNGAYEPGEAFKKLSVFNAVDANFIFGNKSIWFRDIASAERASGLSDSGIASDSTASATGVAPAALILLS